MYNRETTALIYLEQLIRGLTFSLVYERIRINSLSDTNTEILASNRQLATEQNDNPVLGNRFLRMRTEYKVCIQCVFMDCGKYFFILCVFHKARQSVSTLKA